MSASQDRYDAVIVGGGVAGASLGAELASSMSVLLVEMEDQPGYHSTGRSVAFWSETYGGPLVRPLTRLSRALLDRPEPDFSERGFLSPRGAIHIGRAEDRGRRDAMLGEYRDDAALVPIDGAQMRRHVPGLRPEWVVGVEEASTRDIDVAGFHAACLRSFRRRGGMLACSTRLDRARKAADGWKVDLSTGPVLAGLIVDAAGAWADDVAIACGVPPLGITPLLRTVAQLRVDPPAPDAMPLVLDLAERFYFKPVGGGRIWLTPHDEQPVQPADVAPDELDVAVAIDRFQSVVDWRVEAVERKWAGLRSFAPDRLPVYGHDPDVADFFWFAGQGGFGIQTAPAAARLARSLILGTDDPVIAGLDAALYAPGRLR